MCILLLVSFPARLLLFIALGIAICPAQQTPQLITDPGQVSCRVQPLTHAPAPVEAAAWRIPPIEIRCTVPRPTPPAKGEAGYLTHISAAIRLEYEAGFTNEAFDCGSTEEGLVDAFVFVNSGSGVPVGPSEAKGQDQIVPGPFTGQMLDPTFIEFPNVDIPVPGAPLAPLAPAPGQCAEGEPSPSNPNACSAPEIVLRILNVQINPEPNIPLKVTVIPEGSTATEERLQVPDVIRDMLRVTAGGATVDDSGEQRSVNGAIQLDMNRPRYWFFGPDCGAVLSEPVPQQAVEEPGRFWVFYGGLTDVEYDIFVADTLEDSDGNEWKRIEGHDENGAGGAPVDSDGQTQVEPDANGEAQTLYGRFFPPEDAQLPPPPPGLRLIVPFAITFAPDPTDEAPDFRITTAPADSRPPEITIPKYERPPASTAPPPEETSAEPPRFDCAKLSKEIRDILLQPVIIEPVQGPMRPCEARLFGGGAVNGASFAPPEAPNGKLSPGSIFTLFGQALGSTEGAELAFPLDDVVRGLQVFVSDGKQTVNALPVFSNGGQINGILPNNSPRGNVSIWADIDGETTNKLPIQVDDISIGLFAFGGTYGIVQKADAEFSLVSPENPIQPGDTLIAWGTGAGQTSTPSNLAPEVENLPGFRIFLGGVEATRVHYVGPSPCCSGVTQFVFDSSTETPTGQYVPLIVESDSGDVSNAVLLDVDDGSPDLLNPRKPLLEEQRRDLDMRLRARIFPQANGSIELREHLEARLEKRRRLGYIPQFDFPPEGSCWFGNRTGSNEGDILQPEPAEPILEGEMNLVAPDGTIIVLTPRVRGILQWARDRLLEKFGRPTIESRLQAATLLQLLVAFTMTHSDPDEIAEFAEFIVSHTTGDSRIEDLLLPNDDKGLPATSGAPVLISREESYTVGWTGGDPETDVAYILGFAPGEQSVGAFFCTAEVESGAFEIPRYALANMPETPANREGFLAVGVARKLAARTQADVEGLVSLTVSDDYSVATTARFN